MCPQATRQVERARADDEGWTLNVLVGGASKQQGLRAARAMRAGAQREASLFSPPDLPPPDESRPPAWLLPPPPPGCPPPPRPPGPPPDTWEARRDPHTTPRSRVSIPALRHEGQRGCAAHTDARVFSLPRAAQDAVSLPSTAQRFPFRDEWVREVLSRRFPEYPAAAAAEAAAYGGYPAPAGQWQWGQPEGYREAVRQTEVSATFSHQLLPQRRLVTCDRVCRMRRKSCPVCVPPVCARLSAASPRQG